MLHLVEFFSTLCNTEARRAAAHKIDECGGAGDIVAPRELGTPTVRSVVATADGDCGAARVASARHAISWRRSMAGSPKGSGPPICGRRSSSGHTKLGVCPLCGYCWCSLQRSPALKRPQKCHE